MIATPDIKLTHQGYVVDGHLLPRVSSILGELSQPGLEAWKRAVGYEEAERISHDAADYGTRLHAAIERIHAGEIWESIGSDADLEASVLAYQEWFRLNVASVELAEQKVYSFTLGYAGTLDCVLALKDGRRILGDIKSSKTLHPDTMRLQLAAYSLALEEMGYPPVDARFILHLPRNRPGQMHAVLFAHDERDRLTWRCLVQLYRFRRDCAAPRTRKRT